MFKKENNTDSLLGKLLNSGNEVDQLKKSILLSKDKPGIILVNSTTRGEGCTTIAGLLAYTLAKDSTRSVLLVDTDYSDPSVHKLFNKTNATGFCELVNNKLSHQDAIKNAQQIQKLKIITCGNVSDCNSHDFGLGNIGEIFSGLKQHADYVIIDSSALSDSTDAVYLSEYVDGVVIVIQAGETRWEIIQDAIEQFNQVNAKILGTVLNRSSNTIPDFIYKRL